MPAADPETDPVFSIEQFVMLFEKLLINSTPAYAWSNHDDSEMNARLTNAKLTPVLLLIRSNPSKRIISMGATLVPRQNIPYRQS